MAVTTLQDTKIADRVERQLQGNKVHIPSLVFRGALVSALTSKKGRKVEHR